ncbi:DUF2062 domain-containing protein [Aneurinibacillus sp. Ricciae_BoGa-3]|uniref:DUF2062 domain-containing protein n=1 Tax=Aneurinibacillus sp. Ricciae_BoGa-3 TaxID=3022697 RepID=UPI0023406939|nr:DUF2062 domain-containing protein [Aneurinibacillus sp. Ricciae_BoGa-3]WCK56796.1 DUF2062 domain-containing protein [Aneurinibacillus sp. Ricciae_BoGa-3]
MIRVFKLNFIKLLRSPGGAKKVSLGFAIGFGLEMLVISTASLIYILFIPIVTLSRGSLPAAIIGNVVGKLTFLPVLLLPFARKIGHWIYPMTDKSGGEAHFNLKQLLHFDFHGLIGVLHGGIHILIGMSIFGLILGLISYFIVHYFYEKQKMYRLKKRQKLYSCI